MGLLPIGLDAFLIVFSKTEMFCTIVYH